MIVGTRDQAAIVDMMVRLYARLKPGGLERPLAEFLAFLDVPAPKKVRGEGSFEQLRRDIWYVRRLKGAVDEALAGYVDAHREALPSSTTALDIISWLNGLSGTLESVVSTGLPDVPVERAPAGAAVLAEVDAATLYRPDRLIMPPELFTDRVKAAGPSLDSIAGAMAEDMVDRQKARDEARKIDRDGAGFFTCEFCGCRTNAHLRCCCRLGKMVDAERIGVDLARELVELGLAKGGEPVGVGAPGRWAEAMAGMKAGGIPSRALDEFRAGYEAFVAGGRSAGDVFGFERAERALTSALDIVRGNREFVERQLTAGAPIMTEEAVRAVAEEARRRRQVSYAEQLSDAAKVDRVKALGEELRALRRGHGADFEVRLGTLIDDLEEALGIASETEDVSAQALNEAFAHVPEAYRPEFCSGCGAGNSLVDGVCRECGWSLVVANMAAEEQRLAKAAERRARWQSAELACPSCASIVVDREGLAWCPNCNEEVGVPADLPAGVFPKRR